MPLANKKIRVIKREERLRPQRQEEQPNTETEEPEGGQRSVNEREVAPIIESWINDLRRHKDEVRKSISSRFS